MFGAVGGCRSIDPEACEEDPGNLLSQNQLVACSNDRAGTVGSGGGKLGSDMKGQPVTGHDHIDGSGMSGPAAYAPVDGMAPLTPSPHTTTILLRLTGRGTDAHLATS